MDNELQFSPEELEVSDEIMKLCLRSGANDFPYLKNPIFALKLSPTHKTVSICADYSRLYYNPKWIIEQFRRSKEKTVNSIIHCVLHCLYLHPSIISEEDAVFNAAADLAVLIMMYNSGVQKLNVRHNFIDEVLNICGSTSTNDIFKAAKNDPDFLTKVFSVTNKHKQDDHKLWYEKEEEKSPKENGTGRPSGGKCPKSETNKGERNSGSSDQTAQNPNGREEALWGSMLAQAKSDIKIIGYGIAHGNMFMEIKKPDRFSRFSYKEYFRRFAKNEICSEDPETIDMMMYSAGFDMYGDITLVEFSEIRESMEFSDVIIAIDISGSCSGETAVNFLRQVYSLFEEMDIRSNVRIHAVTFDTEIIGKAVIRNRSDAERFIRDYDKHTSSGWGGTNFNCVFDYADDFKKHNNGKKLKGLFFFSDGCGAFPENKRKYLTTFFIPVYGNNDLQGDYSFIPPWVECVKYNDEN